MSRTSRILAHLNLALADAAIGCWEAKYVYDFWRPITATQMVDPTWEPLIGTPGFPEYPSGHSCVSGAAGRILSSYFGEHTPVTVVSNGMPGVTRPFTNLTAALEEVKSARVFAGIHFRTACDDGQALGIGVADYILGHSLLPVDERQEEESEE